MENQQILTDGPDASPVSPNNVGRKLFENITKPNDQYFVRVVAENKMTEKKWKNIQGSFSKGKKLQNYNLMRTSSIKLNSKGTQKHKLNSKRRTLTKSLDFRNRATSFELKEKDSSVGTAEPGSRNPTLMNLDSLGIINTTPRQHRQPTKVFDRLYKIKISESPERMESAKKVQEKN